VSSADFDLTRLRVAPARLQEMQQRAKAKRSKGWHRFYVRVPWAWVERLRGTQRASTYQLALLVLYEDWKAGGQPVVLSNILAEAEGLSRRAKWRALAELEKRGLVTVERRPRQSPRLSLMHIGEAFE
jgi:hypothetical protein